MKRWAYIVLFGLGLVVALVGSALQTNPGYMDAYYYFYTGQQLAHGEGFNEMLIWNYLDDPVGLPHPSHTYWMPAVSLLTALGIKLFSGFLPEFEAAQVILVLIVAFVPPVTAGLAYALSGKKSYGWLAGIMSAFTGFYQPFWTTTDSIGLIMLLGGGFFWVYAGLKAKPRVQALLMGLLAGLIHLTRVEGLLWLGLAGLGVLFDLQLRKGDLNFKQRFRRMFTREYFILGVIVVAGYSVVMAPWFVRNIFAFGGAFPPGGGRALWVRNYDELFTYPASILTPEYLLNSGWRSIIMGRVEALGENLEKTFLAIGVILPGILAIFGLWKWRKKNEVRLGFIGWLILYLVMSLVFPYSGMRGSYFHAGASITPLILAIAPVGLDILVGGILKIFKNWEERRIQPFLSAIVLILVIGYSVISYVSGVVGLDGKQPIVWDRTSADYQVVHAYLASQGAEREDTVVCKNPPGFVVETGINAIGLPVNARSALKPLVAKYDVTWILVESVDQPKTAEFLESIRDTPEFKYHVQMNDIVIFEWVGDRDHGSD